MEPVSLVTPVMSDRGLNDLRALLLSFRRTINPPPKEAFSRLLILLNIFILFTRPQNDLPFLSTLRLTVILFSICSFLWLTKADRNWTRQTAWMLAFIIFQAAFIGLGKLWDPLIVNDRQAYKTWQTLLQMFLCFLFPYVAFFHTGRSLRTSIRVFIAMAAYLGFYALTHSGCGPGDFVADENDLCFTLIALLPFPVLFLFVETTFIRRLIFIGVAAVLLAAIMATSSRGGFLGLVACMLFILFKSPYKGRMLLALAILCLTVSPFVPANYWREMKTIENVSEGTAQTRRDYWRVAWKVFTDPHNTVQGVGLDNTPWRLQDYEGAVNWSMGGREVHSLYFQLLPDLGLIGLLFFWMIILRSYFDNRKILSEVRRFTKLRGASSSEPAAKVSVYAKHLLEVSSDNPQAESLLELSSAMHIARQELTFLRWMLTAVNASFIGVLVAAGFISVLYYPPLWFLACLSASFGIYWKNLRKLLEPIFQGAYVIAEAHPDEGNTPTE